MKKFTIYIKILKLECLDFFFTQISLWLKIIIELKLLTLDSIIDSLTIKPPWKAIRNVCNSREAWVCRIYGSCRAPWCQCRLRPLPYSCSTYRSRVVRRARYIHWRTIFRGEQIMTEYCIRGYFRSVLFSFIWKQFCSV